MTPEFKTYRERFNEEVLKLTRHNKILQSGEYVQLVAIQKHCIRHQLSLADFLSKVDNATEETQILITITLPDVMRTVDYYRLKQHMSKRKLSSKIHMDNSNFLKLYRRGRSFNMKTFYDITLALDVSPSVFMHQCERMVLEHE